MMTKTTTTTRIMIIIYDEDDNDDESDENGECFFKETGWYKEINYMHNWSYKHVLY